MLALVIPETEDILSGMIILNSAPSLWLEAAAKAAADNKLPDLTDAMKHFESNPNRDTFRVALMACAPYYFTPKYLEQGKRMLQSLPFNYHASAWWLQRCTRGGFNAKWIPQSLPTLILGTTHDFIVPFSLFDSDVRFQRRNIKLVQIQNAGHTPWIEDAATVSELFKHYFISLPREPSLVNK